MELSRWLAVHRWPAACEHDVAVVKERETQYIKKKHFPAVRAMKDPRKKEITRACRALMCVCRDKGRDKKNKYGMMNSEAAVRCHVESKTYCKTGV